MNSDMKMSLKDRLSLLTIWIISMILFFVIYLDPLNVFDNSNQKTIVLAIVMLILFFVFWYQRKRIMDKLERSNLV